MSLELVIRPEAEADALEAYRWYSEQLPGLGDDFLAEIDRALESIRANPEAHRKLHREFRRVLTRRFPYAVFYARFGATASSCLPFSTRHAILGYGRNVAGMPANKPLETDRDASWPHRARHGLRARRCGMAAWSAAQRDR